MPENLGREIRWPDGPEKESSTAVGDCERVYSRCEGQGRILGRRPRPKMSGRLFFQKVSEEVHACQRPGRRTGLSGRRDSPQFAVKQLSFGSHTATYSTILRLPSPSVFLLRTGVSITSIPFFPSSLTCIYLVPTLAGWRIEEATL